MAAFTQEQNKGGVTENLWFTKAKGPLQKMFTNSPKIVLLGTTWRTNKEQRSGLVGVRQGLISVFFKKFPSDHFV